MVPVTENGTRSSPAPAAQSPEVRSESAFALPTASRRVQASSPGIATSSRVLTVIVVAAMAAGRDVATKAARIRRRQSRE
jgi:hypothetical protein